MAVVYEYRTVYQGGRRKPFLKQAREKALKEAERKKKYLKGEISLKEYYSEYVLPYALQYGMTTHQFWHEDMDLYDSYHKAYERNLSYTAWINGMFIKNRSRTSNC